MYWNKYVQIKCLNLQKFFCNFTKNCTNEIRSVLSWTSSVCSVKLIYNKKAVLSTALTQNLDTDNNWIHMQIQRRSMYQRRVWGMKQKWCWSDLRPCLQCDLRPAAQCSRRLGDRKQLLSTVMYSVVNRLLHAVSMPNGADRMRLEYIKMYSVSN